MCTIKINKMIVKDSMNKLVDRTDRIVCGCKNTDLKNIGVMCKNDLRTVQYQCACGNIIDVTMLSD